MSEIAARNEAPATRTATMLLAQAKQMIVRASRASASLMKMFERSYEPSKYYMRGPGPKAREAELRSGRPGGATEASARG